MAPKKPDKFHWARDAARVQRLGDGSWVRLFDHEGRSHHLPARPGVLGGVLDAIYAEDPECAQRIVTQLGAAGIDPEWVLPDAEDVASLGAQA